MNSRDQPESILRRYSGAAGQTGPKIAGRIPGADADGYWIDNRHFYFLANALDPSLGRIAGIPSIADCEGNHVEEVISLTALARLITDYSGRPTALNKVSAAQIDMRDRDTLGISVDGMDYLLDWRRRDIVSGTQSFPMPALYSADGRYACFIKGYDLWLNERDRGRQRALTTDGAPHHCYGQASEMNLSAITYRHRPYPVGLWSPDSEWFLTCRIDERELPDFALTQSAPPGGGRFLLHHYRYPTPADPLPIAIYVAIHVATGRVVFFDDFPVLATSLSPFLVGSAWFGQKDTAWFLRFDRYFKRGELIAVDLHTGTGRVVITETTASGYIDLHPVFGRNPNVRTLIGSDEVIWFSERDGWGHLYLYDGLTGALKNPITSGEWLVRDVVHVDEERRKVLFLAGGVQRETDPARRSLCSVNLDGSGFEVLLTHEGDIFVAATESRGHDQDRPFCPSRAPAGISPDGRFAVVQYTTVDQGNVTKILDLSTRRSFITVASELPEDSEIVPRRFTALGADGVTRLHGVMFLPPEFDETHRYALIDFIYPGPQYAHQPQFFRSLNSSQSRALAELGFVSIMIDTRGTPLRSRAFHQVGYGELLEPQLADHAAVVRELCSRLSFLDGTRIGIIGQSAGGAATARALFDYGDVFKVGVALCGVHDSSRHISMWSDKYRGPPNNEAWSKQANNSVAGKLEGKLLLISGDMDECVHVGHTFSLVDALIRANRDFDMLIVPNAGHDVLSTNAYVQRRIWDYFVRNLLGEEPPVNFEVRFEQYELDRFSHRSMKEYR